MKTAAGSGEVAVDGRPKLGLCVLCGLPAAGKSTFARALALRLRQERGWAVGVLSYDDVLPSALPDGADTQPRPSQWKMFRQELLKYLECFLVAVIGGALEAQPCHLLAKTAVSRPLFLVLDDNFYYQSMRYEVYQLARKYSLGFCQLFLDCPLETCLLRNGQRPQPLPNKTIHLMEKKIEKPNPEKNSWEHNSLMIQSAACPVEASLEVTNLLLTALENPIKCVEDNTEQKETDRIICSTNILHKADETLRRTISHTMKEAKDEQIPLNNLKRLAEELNKLKADFLEDLRQGNRKYLCFQQTTDLSDVISSFCDERDTVVQKYFSKQH
ncbi:L-seryl-tRNA(Sec) kinase isoform X2 [Mesocricetus auratus]|uniref:L-seryl-tRNA(Sec) kinase isoform X2 n=1 Tax=Mesocricetus auratus TaxID=10036 RepID=A0A1U8C009_MESAU|nr:L-seryl-tRNA(Sec) kinase isoform X2 [Mesocricetus auratus]